MLPIVVRYFSTKNGVSNKVIEIANLRDEKSATMMDQIEGACEKFNVVEKVIGLGADNAAPNFGGLTRGGKKNLFALMKEKLPNCSIGVGCNAHITHNTVDYAVGRIELFDIEAIVVKIYKHFSQHTVRVTRLKNICDDFGIEYEKLLGYGATRFLAFKGCIDRIISQFEVLKSFFTDPEEKCPPKLKSFFDCPIAKLLLIFVRDQCHIFEDSIKKLEGDAVTGFDALEIMNQLKLVVECRLKDNFQSTAFRNELEIVQELLPFKFTILEKKKGDNLGIDIDDEYLMDIFEQFHIDCISYVTKWMEPLLPLKIWSWASLKTVPEWKNIEPCLDELTKKKFFSGSDDVEVHSEFCNVKLTIGNLIAKWECEKTTTEDRWLETFESLRGKNVSFKKISKLVEYAMVIPGKTNVIAKPVVRISNCFS